LTTNTIRILNQKMKKKLKVPEIHRRGYIFVDKHDKRLMIKDLKRYLKKEYHYVLKEINESDLNTIWTLLHGKLPE